MIFLEDGRGTLPRSLIVVRWNFTQARGWASADGLALRFYSGFDETQGESVASGSGAQSASTPDQLILQEAFPVWSCNHLSRSAKCAGAIG